MKNKILSIFASMMLIFSSIIASPANASSLIVNGTLTNVGDTVSISPRQLSQVNIGVSDVNTSGATLVAESSTTGLTGSYTSITVLSSGGGRFISSITNDGNYSTTGIGYGYFRIRLSAITSGTVGVSLISQNNNNNETVTTAGAGGGSSPQQIAFNGGGSGRLFGFDGQGNMGSEGAFVINTDSEISGKSVTAVNVSCMAYSPFQISSNPGLGTNVYNPEDNGINGGVLTFEMIAADGTYTLLDNLTLPNSPTGGPYVNTATFTLSSPVSALAGSNFLVWLPAQQNTSDQYYQRCTASLTVQ